MVMGNVYRGHTLRIAIGITALVLLAAGGAAAMMMVSEAPSVPWWDASWRFRLPIAVEAAGFERYEKPVEIGLNFTQILGGAGQTGTFDENSIRVVEVDSAGLVLNATVPLQFDKDPDFNADTNASGTVIFIMNGTTQAGGIRYYHIYFDLKGAYYQPLLVAPLVTLTDNIMDEGQLSYEIKAAGSTYYFQKQAGGFSSLDDASGNDWISYNNAAGSAGAYRGIPNAVNPEGYFHPGFKCCTSNVVTQGPLKVRIRSVSGDGNWESIWDIYPGYATMNMTKAGHDYWMLYEGTPGGAFEPDTDFMVRSDETKTLLSQSWYGDIQNEEWVYFSDPNVGRSLFVAHHEDDALQDEYWPHDNMTVFGFGRTEQPLAGLISSVPQHFTIGLMDGTEFSQSSKTVYSAYKDLTITKGVAEQYNLPPSEIVNYTPPTPENPGSTSGNFWINQTWQAGTGNVTDSYNVSVNGIWTNGTTVTYSNISAGPHGRSNITVYAYNNSGILSLAPVTWNTQVVNNMPVMAGIGNKTITAGTELTFKVLATDADSDTMTYGTNATKGILDTTSGVYSWTPGSGDVGTYTWSFNSSDNYSAVAVETIEVAVSNRSLTQSSNGNSPSSSSSGGSGGGGGGGASGENYYNIEFKDRKELDIYKDRTACYLFTSQRNPVVFVNITGNTSSSEIITTVEVLKNTSSLVKNPAPGAIYKNMNIWVGASGFAIPRNIKSAAVGFRVENSWLDGNALARSNVGLARWDGSKWNQLDTQEKTRDGNYTYFEAKTDSFSHFAITGSNTGATKIMRDEKTPAATAGATGTPAIAEAAETPAMKEPAVISTRHPIKDTPGLEVNMMITAFSMIITGLLAIYISGRKRG